MKGRTNPSKLVIFTPFLLIFALNGCDWGKNGTHLCKNNPELCDDLHQDAWCWQEKSTLIDKRYASKLKEGPEGKLLYQQILALEDYNRCIEVASGVQHVINTQRTHERAKAFSDSARTLTELQQQTKNSDDLFLAYYHWARFSDDKARDKVLKAAENDRISDPELLGSVAAYYEKFNFDKSREMYFTAMARADETNVDPNWLLGLARIANAHRAYPEAYLFTRANVILADHEVDEDEMLRMLHGEADNIDELDDIAEDLADALEDGEYGTSSLRSRLENF
ncbi:DUF2989 domain-containing protein [Shewanella corallii]|uniref:DUF2989 domain-containing protein n=1 Tax=Shewanella corallii TaxID=560080 RepID=A0ABT0N6K0_9GAMM|nr:DUF2989 domain-containing protein [Shewanella corallii]MCL2914083.1 DUF2989 domain-containing protein [Shewanella corallii]